MPRMCAGGVGGLSPLGWTGPGDVRYGSCRQRVRVRGKCFVARVHVHYASPGPAFVLAQCNGSML